MDPFLSLYSSARNYAQSVNKTIITQDARHPNSTLDVPPTIIKTSISHVQVKCLLWCLRKLIEEVIMRLKLSKINITDALRTAQSIICIHMANPSSELDLQSAPRRV